jgi:hypothetical protein
MCDPYIRIGRESHGLSLPLLTNLGSELELGSETPPFPSENQSDRGGCLLDFG